MFRNCNFDYNEMYRRNNTDSHVNCVRNNVHHANKSYYKSNGNYNDYPLNYNRYESII